MKNIIGKVNLSKLNFLFILVVLSFLFNHPLYAYRYLPQPFSQMHQYYFNLGLGYAENIAGGTNSTYLLTQPPIPGITTLNFHNTTHANGPEIKFAFGRIMQLDPHWFIGLGMQLIHDELTQKGYSILSYSTVKNAYTANIMVNNIGVVTQVLYCFNHYWQAFADLSTGVAFLKSDNYKNASYGDTFASKLTHNISYGVAIGLRHYLSDTVSVGINLGYRHLGKAKFGQFNVISPSEAVGTLEQSITILAATLNFTYWF